MKEDKRVVVALTGASGAVVGVEILRILKSMGQVQTHLIISDAAKLTLSIECDLESEDLEPLAERIYSNDDVGACLASGSFDHDGMLIVPCTIKTLSAIANCYCSQLISRAADVCLKEGRPLLLGVRETPFHLGHLNLMKKVVEMGAIIFPPIPSFYNREHDFQKIVNHIAARMLMRIGLKNEHVKAWKGVPEATSQSGRQEPGFDSVVANSDKRDVLVESSQATGVGSQMPSA